MTAGQDRLFKYSGKKMNEAGEVVKESGSSFQK
jgi:hypothetical protein